MLCVTFFLLSCKVLQSCDVLSTVDTPPPYTHPCTYIDGSIYMVETIEIVATMWPLSPVVFYRECIISHFIVIYLSFCRMKITILSNELSASLGGGQQSGLDMSCRCVLPTHREIKQWLGIYMVIGNSTSSFESLNFLGECRHVYLMPRNPIEVPHSKALSSNCTKSRENGFTEQIAVLNSAALKEQCPLSQSTL